MKNRLLPLGLPIGIMMAASVMWIGPAPARAAKQSHAASPVYKQPLQPETNPWQDKAIVSRYRFGAYYTRKNVDETWHRFSRTDEYADIMVKFDNSHDELVFWRGFSYRPYWKTDHGRWLFKQVIARSGDGPPERPDKVNRHTRARIIESTDRRIVVHWRYLTDFPADVGLQNLPDQTKFVDEYFIITPDRTVLRAIRPGAPRIEDWHDPARVRLFKVKLTGKAITSMQPTDADRQAALALMDFPAATAPPAVAPLRPLPRTPAPALAWSFDQERGRIATETVTHSPGQIHGHGVIRRTGVSGRALEFDGWTSKVTLPPEKAPKITGQITLDAWIAIAAYPWNFTAIIQQGDVIDAGQGYFLGIDADGKPALAVMVEGKKHLLVAAEKNQRIPRFRWTRITGVIDTDAGRAWLYRDGQPVASTDLPKGKAIDLASDQPITIGQGPPLDTSWPVGRSFGKFPYAFDGLIDEVRVYDRALTAGQVAAVSKAMALTDARRTAPDIERRVLPAGDSKWNRFAAHYTHLHYHRSWDNLFRMSGQPDIVVTFDKLPGRYVLWHGVGYIPMMVSENGRWYSNEFNETWWRGCCEPMSDKKVIFGRVKILEQSPARVVLKWRFPLNNVGYQIYAEGWDDQTGWGEWCDWYMTIYPDGSVAKRMRIYMSTTHSHEWQESMAIFAPEQRPEQVVETRPALVVGTMTGQVRRYDWIDAPPGKIDYSDVILHIVNLKAQFDPYTIVRVARGNVYRRRGPSPYAVFPAWNHWPVSQIPSDGRYVHYPDRAAHSSLTHVYWPNSQNFGERGTYEEKILLEGLSDQTPEQLLTLARSFVNPPQLTALGHGVTGRFDPAQRAYVLDRASADVTTLKVKLDASGQSPVCNPAFVVENWAGDNPAKIRIDGRSPGPNMDIRQGVVPRANGVNALVVWIERTATGPMTVEISQ